jgi:hypothetical protein
VEQVVVVVPVDPHEDEGEQVPEQVRRSGGCSSSTMIVMMMAMTPSLKASSRFRVMWGA